MSRSYACCTKGLGPESTRRPHQSSPAPANLKEEAAREIFEQLDLVGERLVAVHPRAEHAWLLGMAAMHGEDVVLVGARGFEPMLAARVTIPILRRAQWLHAAAVAG